MEYYEVAAKWWTEQLRNVKPSHFNVGEGLPKDGDLLLMFAGMQHANRVGPEDEGALEYFEKRLAMQIKERVEGHGRMCLGADYGPDKMLYDAAVEAGIKGMNFPLKTTMWISKKEVSVQKGSGAKIQKLYPEKNVKK